MVVRPVTSPAHSDLGILIFKKRGRSDLWGPFLSLCSIRQWPQLSLSKGHTQNHFHKIISAFLEECAYEIDWIWSLKQIGFARQSTSFELFVFNWDEHRVKDEKHALLPSCQRASSQGIFSQTKGKWWIVKHKNELQVAFITWSLLELAKLSPSPSLLCHHTSPVWFSPDIPSG